MVSAGMIHIWRALIAIQLSSISIHHGRVVGSPTWAGLLPDSYGSLSADAKQDLLWYQISSSRYSLDQLPIEPPSQANLSNLFVPKYLQKSFTWQGDQMPEGRTRILHPYGSVCKVALEIHYPESSTFTGIFRTGGVGLFRMSVGQITNDSFPVGVALKIFVDGQRSQNFVLVNTVEGQGLNRNFFAKTMRNIFPPAGPYGRELNPAEKAFQTSIFSLPGGEALDHPVDFNDIPLYEQASVQSDGMDVSEVVAPYVVSFRPNPALAYDERDQTDFRKRLAGIPSGTVLYTVVGKRTLDDEDSVMIGQLVSRSEVVTSRYGDEVLFFNHATKSWRP
ncbi:hypothetical protein BV898_13072 [Hypsibius exemplaris]|uniref:Uncharacterized protein n=1 Tax=Hypsibius exemplaris TaxID=2072580 RepID=A0A1W0WBX9_HYPEX|nr:hypothetical protein BV898_13072 [Hypsibius exemplaris]